MINSTQRNLLSASVATRRVFERFINNKCTGRRLGRPPGLRRHLVMCISRKCPTNNFVLLVTFLVYVSYMKLLGKL